MGWTADDLLELLVFCKLFTNYIQQKKQNESG